MRFQLVALAVVILLAGCGGGANEPAATATEAPTPAPTAKPTNTPAETTSDSAPTETQPDQSTPIRTSSGTPYSESSRPINPWGNEKVTVAIRDPESVPEEYLDMVNRALEYWENEGSRYREYDVEFELDQSDNVPGIRIVFVEELPSCGHSRSVIGFSGCAPLINAQDDVHPPEIVHVRSDVPFLVVEDTLKHEFGHVYGLEHAGEPPIVTERPQRENVPDLENQENAYGKRDVAVYVNAPDDKSREEAHRAVEYYQQNPNDVKPDNMNLRIVDEQDEAEISINIVENSTFRWSRCGQTGESNVTTGGLSNGGGCVYNLDDDAAAEFIASYEIYVNQAEVRSMAWHVGYWMGYALGATEDSELPPPFDNRGGNRRF